MGLRKKKAREPGVKKKLRLPCEAESATEMLNKSRAGADRNEE